MPDFTLPQDRWPFQSGPYTPPPEAQATLARIEQRRLDDELSVAAFRLKPATWIAIGLVGLTIWAAVWGTALMAARWAANV